MASRKTLLCCSVLLVMLVCLAGKAGAVVPVETSHYNSNTYTNLNTITSTDTVTFSIAYDVPGDINWYKDGALAQTDVSVTSATFTTAWTSADYGTVKQLKVNSTDAGGTSADTVWNVEVQETGTAVVTETTWVIHYYLTLVVENGWANFPTLYLKTKKPENWIEYVSSGTYIVKANIDVQTNGILKADGISAQVLKVRALPVLGETQQGCFIRARKGGLIEFDSMTVVGWNITEGKESTVNDQSAVLESSDSGTLKVTNSKCRHMYMHFQYDESPGDLLDNNEFYEGNPYNLGFAYSKYQVITHNLFYHAVHHNIYTEDDTLYSYNDIEYNQFIGDPAQENFGDNVVVGRGSKYIGNEFVYAGWNLVETHVDTFCRDNVMHDNGGNHNGFNGMLRNVYLYNDYVHDFTGYSAYYPNVWDHQSSYPLPMDKRPDHVYIINGRAENVRIGLNFCGGYNCYVYNFTSSSCAGVNFQSGCNNDFVRKCRFYDTLIPTDFSFRLCDDSPEKYGWVENVTLLDSVFSGRANNDLGMEVGEKAVLNAINCYRLDPEGKIVMPETCFYTLASKPEIRFYAWLDVLVKDMNGAPVKDANITIEPLISTSTAAVLSVTLPPPPPDLWELPEEPLPLPALADFIRLKTLADGKLPGPNYGWSADPEPCVALLFDRRNRTGSTETSSQYRIKASYHGLEASAIVTPDISWLREDPMVPAHTVELTLNGDSTAGTDTTPPVLTVTAPLNGQLVNSTARITATASDNWDIDRMEIFIDNVSRAVISAGSCTWTTDAYSCSWEWDTARENAGAHTIRVVAHDASGNCTGKTVTVQVLTTAATAGTGNEVIVYPNPYIKGKSQGNACVFANLAADSVVRIYTISGEPVTTLTADKIGAGTGVAWDVSHIGGGVYLYTVQSAQGTKKGKIGIVQ